MDRQETSLGSQLLAAFPGNFQGQELLQLPEATVELRAAHLPTAPLVASMAGLSDTVARSFQDPLGGYELRSKALSVDLRHQNGSKMRVKSFTVASEGCGVE